MSRRTAWNKGLTAATDLRVERNGRALRGGTGKAKTPEAELARRQKISENGKGKIGGYRANAGYTKKYHVTDSFGHEVCLQSSYELRCSEIMNRLGIKWSRPHALKYELDGRSRRYFPDFYLSEHNIYLDTKNDYLAIVDAEKIQAVITQTGADVQILTLDKITDNFLSSLAQK